MIKEQLYKQISKLSNYKNLPNHNLLKPLILWANTNAQLDEFYKRPEINLNSSDTDNEIRNTMRHVTGLGLAAREYGYRAYTLGAIKEGLDILKDLFFHKPIGRISSEVWEDTITDFKNNHRGIQYMLKNPDANYLFPDEYINVI